MQHTIVALCGNDPARPSKTSLCFLRSTPGRETQIHVLWCSRTGMGLSPKGSCYSCLEIALFRLSSARSWSVIAWCKRADMPAKPTRTDRATLNGLLISGKLTSGEQTAFQEMFDKLVQGQIIELSPKQRLWADSVYEKHKLGDIRAESRRQARVKVRVKEANFLDAMPRPLKPPGRS